MASGQPANCLSEVSKASGMPKQAVEHPQKGRELKKMGLVLPAHQNSVPAFCQKPEFRPVL